MQIKEEKKLKRTGQQKKKNLLCYFIYIYVKSKE